MFYELTPDEIYFCTCAAFALWEWFWGVSFQPELRGSSMCFPGLFQLVGSSSGLLQSWRQRPGILVSSVRFGVRIPSGVILMQEALDGHIPYVDDSWLLDWDYT